MRLAIVQADVVRGRTDQNVEKALRFVRQAARRGASLVIFPEMYLTGYEIWSQLGDLSLARQEPALHFLEEEARRCRIAVLMGYPERRSDGIYNTISLLTPKGKILASYRKIHLYGRERHYFRPGSRYRLVRVAGMRIGLLICYDLEFPESARVLALSGADLIAVSSANMAPFREAQDVYVRARAMENELFVALANRVGCEGRTQFVGGSGVWDPSGRPLVHTDQEEGVLLATVDRRRVRRARRQFNYLLERRPDCYAVLSSSTPKRRFQVSRRLAREEVTNVRLATS